MDPLTLAALIQTGYSVGKSIYDANQAKKYSKTPRPDYEIPVSATMAKNRAVAGAGAYGYGGMGRDIARSEQTMANAMPALRNLSGSQQMNMLSALVKGTQQQQADIGAYAEKTKDRREQQAQQMLMAYAPYEQQQFMWNKGQPYLNAMATAANFEKQARAGMDAAMGSFTNLLGSGKFKKTRPAFRSGVDSSGNPVSINPDMPAGYVPEGFSAAPVPPDVVVPEESYAEQGLRQPSVPMEDPASRYSFPTYGNTMRNIPPDYIRQFQLPIQLPNPMTKQLAEGTLGTPISDDTFDYYDIGSTYNNAFNSLYRQKYSPY